MILLALALLAATPSTLVDVINKSKPGDTVRLVAGNYPFITVRHRTWSPPLIVDASAATIAGVSLIAVSGVTWSGGAITGDTKLAVPDGAGFSAVKDMSNITVTGVHFSYFHHGIIFSNVNGGKIAGNWFTHMASDGIDIALSRSIVIDRNACTDFTPAPAAHPDCIQLWSRPESPPTADIQVTNNSAVGTMQGIGLFNHVRGGIDDGGFDRIMIRGNTILNTYADGISVYDCRGCTVRDNDVNSLPNYWNRAQLYILGGTVAQCGNKVTMVTRQGTPPCSS